jgi:hypothetical protein
VGDLEQVPDALARWDVLIVAGVLYAMEFVADKIPYVDSTWDLISTAIRPTVGAVVGVLIAGDADSLDQAVSGAVGGGTALASHLVKAGTRLAVNTSPEPVTNIGISLIEDVAVLGVVWFAIEHPVAAAAIAAALLATGMVALYFAARLIRRGWRRWRAAPRPIGGSPGGIVRLAWHPFLATRGCRTRRTIPRAALGFRPCAWWWWVGGSAGWPARPGSPSSATRSPCWNGPSDWAVR